MMFSLLLLSRARESDSCQLCRHGAAGCTRLIVLEDVHWLDILSWKVIERLLATSKSFFLLTSRENDEFESQPCQDRFVSYSRPTLSISVNFIR
jgi:hypothetical protein